MELSELLTSAAVMIKLLIPVFLFLMAFVFEKGVQVDDDRVDDDRVDDDLVVDVGGKDVNV